MPEVTRSSPPPAAVPAAAATGKSTIKVRLVTTPRKPVYDINNFHVLVIGEPGSGKTTLGTQEPLVQNLSFDPINPSYEIIQEQMTDWAMLLAYLAALEGLAAKGQFPYKRVQIDGAGLMADACQRHVCVRLGIGHPSELGYAKGFDAVNSEFGQVLDRFMALPCGIWFIAHAKEKQIQKQDGRQIDRLSPDIKGKMEGLLVGKCHMVVSIQYLPGGSKSRLAVIRGDENTVAKCNIDGRFLTPDGKQVQEIVLGSEGPKSAWEKFLRAFNNQQRWLSYEHMNQILAAQKAREKAKTAEAAVPVEQE